MSEHTGMAQVIETWAIPAFFHQLPQSSLCPVLFLSVPNPGSLSVFLTP